MLFRLLANLTCFSSPALLFGQINFAIYFCIELLVSRSIIVQGTNLPIVFYFMLLVNAKTE